MPLHVDVLFARVQIAFLILELLLEVRLESPLKVRLHQLLVQTQRLLNPRHIFEVTRVRDPQTLHAVGVTPLLEMFLEGTSAPVGCPTTNLTLKLFTQTMQLIQPVGYRLSIPSHRQRLRIILQPLLILIRVLGAAHSRRFLQHFCCGELSTLFFDLGVAARLLLADLILG